MGQCRMIQETQAKSFLVPAVHRKIRPTPLEPRVGGVEKERNKGSFAGAEPAGELSLQLLGTCVQCLEDAVDARVVELRRRNIEQLGQRGGREPFDGGELRARREAAVDDKCGDDTLGWNLGIAVVEVAEKDKKPKPD